MKEGGSIISYFKKYSKEKKNLILDRIKKNFKIELMPHQLFPGYYLKYLKPNQKGLLLNHHMGTGKSFTILNIIHEFKDYKPIIVCPEYLIANWYLELNKLDLGINITFTTYNNLISFIKENDVSNSIIVFDDGHNLVYDLRTLYSVDDREFIINELKKCERVIISTGTPFYKDEYDIIRIINIVSGLDLLPYDTTLFQQKYFKRKLLKTGYALIINVLKANRKLLTPFIIFNLASTLSFIINPDNLVSQKVITGGDILGTIGDGATTTINGVAMGVEYFQDFTKTSLNFVNDKYMELLALMGIAVPPLVAPLVISSFFMGLNLILSIFPSYNLMELIELNGSKLGKDIESYVSYYNNISKESFKKLKISKCHDISGGLISDIFCKSYIDKLNDSDYPSSELFIKYVNYSKEQFKLLVLMAYNRLDKKEYTELNVSEIDISNNVFSNIKNPEFLKYGKIIGNLELVSEIESGVTVEPEKFKKILEISNNQQSVIYSNYYEKGIILFRDYLEKNNKTYTLLDKNDSDVDLNNKLTMFKEEKIQYLLLHPIYIEGISIHGARQLHILEPFESYSLFDQLCHRVIRYKSHSHLDVKDRKIKIYQWVCRNYSFMSSPLKRLNANNKTLGKKLELFGVWKSLIGYENDISPDMITKLLNDKTYKLFLQFEDDLNEYSIENCSDKNKKFYCDLEVPFKKVIEK